ncbi:MutS-related protein [Psychroflexus sp. MBR-150]|jgi:DNA mismatch repair ATPase MutS
MNRIQFYSSQIEQYHQSIKVLKRKLLYISLVRIAVFVIIAIGIYFLWSSINIVVLLVLVFAGLFIFLIKKQLKLKNELKKIRLLVTINKNEILALKGDISHFKNGSAYKDSTHAFADDIDLFGEHSFFQFINRTALIQGEIKLAKYLKSNSISNISNKQKAVQELSNLIKFRQNFTAEALALDKQDRSEEILKTLSTHRNFIPKYFNILSILFSLISISVLSLFIFDFINFKQVLLWFFIGLGLTGIYLKKINVLSLTTAKAQNLFRQYQKLIQAIEAQSFKSQNLNFKQSLLKSDQRQASQFMKSFSQHIDALEQRQNMMLGVVLNAFFLWDIRQCLKIERWLDQHKNELKAWFDVIAYFDAQNSLANLAYNQTEFVFPKINLSDSYIIECESATHPLIPDKQAVRNSFAIQDNEFLIITGANMAGKSTFLRTVSLMIVMANIGLPVCAKSCLYRPIKLITSMRTSDSLTDDSSYFFSELTRLKTIVEHLKNDSYFVILDEILKGTNSHDKAKGSKQFIKKLASTNSTGIVATHDLSLCSLSKKLENVKNYYFDAQIIDDELYFDYSLKEGVCQNMNASFLLKKMGIV